MDKKIFLASLLALIFAFLIRENLLAGDKIFLVAPGSQILLSFKNTNEILIDKTAYTFERWGPNRLKLKQKDSGQGVFLKRLGIRLVIRNLQGNILHIIQKEGDLFRVETPVGAHLVYLKVSPKAVTVFKKEGETLYTITSKNKKVFMKDKKGNIFYTLEGETQIYPASFLCLPELSWEERAACYLLFKNIPFFYQ